MKQKAWATLEIKSLNEESRTISGIASTPSTDRTGDVVNPLGAEYNLPIPFLWQHDASQPIGQVISATPNASGIPVEIQIANVSTPGTLKDRLDEAWQSIKSRLVRGLSIGFTPLEYSFIDSTGGMNFKRWAWLELSAVTIPANAEASIATIKRFDAPEVIAKDKRIAEMKALTKEWDGYDITRGKDINSPVTVHQMNASCARVAVDVQGMVRDVIEILGSNMREALKEKAYFGIWAPGEYKEGNLITFKGGLWFAVQDTSSRPGSDQSWQLAVKSGR